MKVNGYRLREALKQQELRKDAAAKQFSGTLKKFPDEDKPTPEVVAETFLKAETVIAKLQVAQMRYNLQVPVEVMGERMTLAEAIKRVGGQGRSEKMWKGVIPGGRDRYALYDEDTRDPNQVRAKPTLDPDRAVILATEAAKRAGAFRAAIATGNAVEVEIENLDPALFE